jgi:hypothetical protein
MNGSELHASDEEDSRNHFHVCSAVWGDRYPRGEYLHKSFIIYLHVVVLQ